MCILVIDIGGSSVKTAIFETNIKDHQVFKSPDSWEKMSEELDKKIRYYLGEYPVSAISFSVPGIANQETGNIDGASSLHYLHGFSFKDYFSEKYQYPVSFENDANCACHAEITLGAAKGAKNVIFIIIGTGIGGALVLDGNFIQGAHNFAGEFGMMLVDDNREWGEVGSAVHMAKKYSESEKEVYQGYEVFELASKGNKKAQEYCENLYYQLAKGIYNLQYIIDPECIVIGGGVSNNIELLDNIERKLAEIMNYGQRSPIKPKIVSSFFKNEANLIGAGLIASGNSNLNI